MDADERLTALKKAYADIILNTAKEAAARIMVSERRALRFQHELYVAKEDALQMLQRLKRMMDSKICEAEIASSSQQKKIEELEAQLQEAEDIVRDLREELRQVQAELERESNNKIHVDEHDTATTEETSEDHTLYTSQSVILPHSESPRESVLVSDLRNLNLSPGNEVSHDIPSLVLRSKEPELYRNGCTQRIRAYERNLLNGELSVSEYEEGKRICTTPTYVADNMCTTEKKGGVLTDSRFVSWYQVQAGKCFRRKRKRTTRYKKNRTPSWWFLPEQAIKTDQTPAITCLRTHPNLVINNAQSIERPSQMAPQLTSDSTQMSTRLGFAKTDVCGGDCVKACGVQSTINKDDILTDKLPMRQEVGSTEISEVPVGRMNLDKDDVPLINSNGSKASDTTHTIHSQPLNDRIIKYTFQRKRKKVSFSGSDGNASVENSTLKRTEEKQPGSMEPQKSSLITESSRDSRRLAQVARQLISLSEKKWWQ
ncbi:unnamed protein product [Ilex paraguariensis]|uniref:Uncharacterized protein n=1 Tax=Ilex paraguariensis TaxID=185542 RepID=A0ABC8TT27_9AQUA